MTSSFGLEESHVRPEREYRAYSEGPFGKGTAMSKRIILDTRDILDKWKGRQQIRDRKVNLLENCLRET